MGRVMAIDYGLKRTGLAVTDDTRNFAFGLTTVYTTSLMEYLTDYCRNNDVEAFVVGVPVTLTNLPTDATPHVEGFIRRLTKAYPAKAIHRMDERFTSSIASQSLIDSGVKKKGRQNKGLVDMVSATIILQSWIEKNSARSSNS